VTPVPFARVTSISAMGDDRPSKLRRIDALRRRVPHVSASALSAILRDVSTHGLPEMDARSHFREARDDVASTDTPYGHVLQESTVPRDGGGRPIKVPFAHPLALLWQLYATCEGFFSLLTSRLREHPCSIDHPWTLVAYSDEVTPGNVLAHDTTRKASPNQ